MPLWKQFILFCGLVTIASCAFSPTPYNKSMHYKTPGKMRTVKPRVIKPVKSILEQRIECIITFTERKIDGLVASKICSDIFKNR